MTTFASPHWLTDEQLAQLNIDPLVTSEFRSYHYQQSFGIEVWYDQLKEHTFQTSFLPLSLDEVKAIVEAHNTKNLNFSQNDVLQNLSNKIQAEIEKRGNRGVFIKLNTRSPKDVCIDSIDDPENVDKLLEWVEDDLLNSNKTRKELEHNFTGDEIIRSFTKACTKSMKISNSTEALSTLIKSSRIFQDLSRVERFGENAKAKIVFREWNENVVDRPHMEFRGFVYKNNLNALSQYDNITFYPELFAQHQELGQTILNFFNDQIRDKLQHIESYVIDFFVDVDKIYVIELNPFHTGAGPCLFTWRENRELFMNGPFEFRVVQAPGENPLHGLHGFWERTLSRYLIQPEVEKSAPATGECNCNASASFPIATTVLLVLGAAALVYFFRKDNNRKF